MKKRTTYISAPARIINIMVIVFTVLVGLCLVGSSMCTYISPYQFKYAPLGVMTFPIWLIAVILLLIVELIWWRKTALILVAAILLSWPQIANFSPLHLPKGKMSASQMERSFTLMDYNVYQFFNQDSLTPRYTNEQIDYILEQSPDIVCLAEARCLTPGTNTNITSVQLNELEQMYKYIYIDGESLAFLSKFEAEPIHINFPTQDFQSGDIGAWRVNVNGKIINVFGVHLRSFALSLDDKGLFKEITSPQKIDKRELQEIKEAKNDLLPKITTASKERVEQFELLLKYLKKYGGENVIVCGDFNDPVGSYGIHELEKEARLKQVYSQIGCGPMITYYANHFFFRIDHVLYRGDIEPWSIRRGKIKASDHYPLITTFVINE